MISLDPSWLLALPLLFAMGWVSARFDLRQSRAARRSGEERLSLVIAALVTKKREEAATHLLSAIRDNPDDLSLQQALGVLLREKGEPDRAIEVRLSLLARPGIDEELKQQALLELARDYLAAGILDRAERTIDLVIHEQPTQAAHALRLSLMQRLSRWPEALDSAEWLLGQGHSEPWLERARFHFLMESGRAEEARGIQADHPRLVNSAPAAQGLFICSGCGFQTRRHGWQCAGCGHWDTLALIQ